MDVQRLLDGFLGNVGGAASGAASAVGSKAGGLPGGLLGGAAAGGLVAAVLSSKKARKVGGKALTYGGLAVLGGLAYKTWSDYKANRPQAPAAPSDPIAPPPADSGFDPSRAISHDGSDFRLTLVRAMISAAMADGHIDQREHGLIREQVDGSGLAADEKAFLFEQLNKPADPIAIASLASGEEQATEVYLASAIVLDVDIPEDKRYLERLGDALRLPEELRRRLEAELQAALPAA